MTPKFTKELGIDAYDDYDFDLDTGEFIKYGLLALQISGIGRAYWQSNFQIMLITEIMECI